MAAFQFYLQSEKQKSKVDGDDSHVVLGQIFFHYLDMKRDRLCGLVVRVLGFRSGGPGSIPATTRKKKSSGSGTGSTQPREYN
jgi:hypothetical protein